MILSRNLSLNTKNGERSRMESVETFLARSYWHCAADIVLVWKSERLKKMPANRQNKPEVWDYATTQRYLQMLRTPEQIIF